MGVVLDGVVKPFGYVGVFVHVLEVKAFIPEYDAPERETTAKVL